jgi:hypothetical protein
MTYKFRRREARPFLTLGELIADKHPELWQALQYHLPRDVTGVILAPAELRGEELYYAAIMQERPKPGRGGQ